MGFEKVQAEDTVVVTFQDSLAWNTPLLLRGGRGVEKRWRSVGESPGECRAFLLVPARSSKFGNPIFLSDGKRI